MSGLLELMNALSIYAEGRSGEQMKTYIRILSAIVAIGIYAAQLAAQGSSQLPLTDEGQRAYFDSIFFPQFYWGMNYNDVELLLGKPLGDKSVSGDSITYWFHGAANLGLPTAIAAGFSPATSTLHSIQLFFLMDRDDSPDMYIQDYRALESALTQAYGKSLRFDWYSSIKEPDFSGEEIKATELSFIAMRQLENAALAHTMIYQDGHISHAFSFYNYRIQSVEQTIKLFEASSMAAIYNK